MARQEPFSDEQTASPGEGIPDEPDESSPDESLWTAYSIQARVSPRRLAVLGLAALGGLLLANYGFFALFGRQYFRWYLENGAAFALVFALISGAIDLDRYDGLVAVAPGRFLGAWMDVVGSIFLWWSVSLGPSKRRAPADIFPTALIAAVVGVALIGWVLVIAPMQYLVTLLCGAPARLAIASDRKLVVLRDAQVNVWKVVPVVLTSPAGATEIGFRTKPVTFTNAIAAGVLWAVSFAL